MKQTFIPLNGIWRIAKDFEGISPAAVPSDAREIAVYAHVPNTKWTMDLSYANLFPGYHGFVWYYKPLDTLPARGDGERIFAEFEAVSFLCRVYLNGVFVGEHRGNEEAFSFDLTDALNAEDNLLAVQVFEPRASGRRIEGIALHEIPNSCFANLQAFMFGTEDTFCLECVGGILGSVSLRTVPAVVLYDFYLRPNPKNGDVEITVTLQNSGAPCTKEISVSLFEHKSGAPVATVAETAALPHGTATVTLSANISHHVLWDLDTPYLYCATLALDGTPIKTSRFGFRDLRIEHGYFFLNGRRIFLKFAHCAPIADYAVQMKALGFNAIRTIARDFTEEFFHVCDEIGLLVIDAAATAWGMTLHENTVQQIETSNLNVLRKHRNHPCAAMHCLLNELSLQPELFSHFAAVLPKLRAAAPDTLFLLHSGRWDRDNSFGSASNPGSFEWDVCFGAERDASFTDRTLPVPYDGNEDAAMGDIHVYPFVPIEPDMHAYLRNIAEHTAPVLVSETGIGSQYDCMSDYLTHSRQNLAGSFTTPFIKTLWDGVEEFLEFYDLHALYPVASDFSRATEAFNGHQRRQLYDVYRANPKINGMGFTSFGTSHEGTLQEEGVLKNTLAYAIQQGNAPLRFSLFADRTVYASAPFSVEAVLCNEDVLPPGRYSAVCYIRGNDGVCRRTNVSIDYPDAGYGGLPPLAHSVYRDTLTLPAGEYTFSARLTSGGVAFDGDLPITVCDASERVERAVTAVGLAPRTTDFLAAHGVTFTEDAPLILVGIPTANDVKPLLDAALRGRRVVFLNHEAFAAFPALVCAIAGEGARCADTHDTIYHQDHVAKRHPLFAGIADPGVLEADRFGIVFPHALFRDTEKPTKTVCASMRVDTSYLTSGLSFGEFGNITLSTFRIEQALTRHPFADKLLLNLLRAY